MKLVRRLLVALLALASLSASPAEAQRIIGKPVGLSIGGIQFTGSAGPALAYAPVLLIAGDSQCHGTTESGGQTTLSSAYGAVTAKVKVLNAAGAYVDYTPGTITGMNFGTNTGQTGAESQIATRFRALYPNDTLYIIKECASGSYQSIGASLGTYQGSASGSTHTYVSGTAPGSNSVLTGTGLTSNGKTVYFPFSGFVTEVGGNSANVSPATGTITITKYNGTLSWSSANGLTYNGNSGGTGNGARARIAAGITAAATASGLPARVVGVVHVLGTNDMAATATGSAFQSEATAFFTRINADLPLSNAKIVMVRVGTGGTASTTVRTAQATIATADPQVYLVSTDSYTRWDGTHWNSAGLIGIGNDAFDIIFGSGLGIAANDNAPFGRKIARAA